MTTVNQFFNGLLDNLKLPTSYDDLVKVRRDNLYARLREMDKTARVFTTGSYKKKTLVRPLGDDKFDIDCFAVLSSELYYRFDAQSNGQSRLLQYIREHLEAYPDYSRTRIKGNGQAVTLELAIFDVDVVPAFSRKDLGLAHSWSDGGYLIPDSRAGGSWIATYPEEQESELNRTNADYGYRFKPLIRLIKGWTKAKNVVLTGFMVEVLVSNYTTTLSPGTCTYQPMVERFFYKLDNGLISSYYKGTEDVLSPLSTTAYPDYTSKLSSAASNAAKARELEDEGETEAAIQVWGRVFGGYC